MKILAIEADEQVRDLYRDWFFKKSHEVQTISYAAQEINVQKYDVVIVDKEETKHFLVNIRYDHVIVAATQPTAKKNGSWAISKPFHMEELDEIVDVIQGKYPIDKDMKLQ